MKIIDELLIITLIIYAAAEGFLWMQDHKDHKMARKLNDNEISSRAIVKHIIDATSGSE